MISDETREAIVGMRDKGMKIRQIAVPWASHATRYARSSKGAAPGSRGSGASYENEMPLIHEAFIRCRGNVVRVAEILAEKGIRIGYSTLTRIARDQSLREPKKARAGVYAFGPGLEIQHDTSPHG